MLSETLPLVMSDRVAALESAIRQDEALSNSQYPTAGNIYHVRPSSGSDGNSGTTPATAFKTLAAALAAATANQNDRIYLHAEADAVANTTCYQSAALNWNKDMVHLIGVNAGGFISKRSRIAPLSTAAAFANLFVLSANGCFIQNIEFFQGAGSTTLSAAQTCVTVSGERNHFVNCQISGIGDTTMDYAGSNSLTISSEENTFDDCYIGLDTVIRATSVTEVIFSGLAARNLFRRCQFETYTSSTAFKLITIPTTLDRFVRFIDCDFIAVQNIASAAVPTGVIGITTMNGQVIMRNPFVFGPAQITDGSNNYVQVLGFNGVATAHLNGIAQGVNHS